MSEEPKPSDHPAPRDTVNVKPGSSGDPAKAGKQARRSSARKSAKGPAKPAPEKAARKDGAGDSAGASGKEAVGGETGKEPVTGPSGNTGEGSTGSSGGRRRRSRGGRDSSPAGPTGKHDPELLVKHAWKIYLGEITEEGVTLMDDKAARQLAARSFELASIFLDEQGRRSQA